MLATRAIRRHGSLTWLALIAGCGAADTTAPPPALKFVVTTDAIDVQAGSSVLVTAVLSDADGRPAAPSSPRLVQWSANSTQGRFSTASTYTISNVAQVRFVPSPRAGTQVVLFASTAGNVSGSSPVITTIAGAPAKYAVVPAVGTAPPGTTVDIRAQLQDLYDNPLASAVHQVTWSSTGVGGSFSSPTSTTNEQGIATVRFTTGTLQGISHTVTATDEDARGGSSPRITMTLAIPALAAVEVGVSHGCALTQSGRAFCWGSNFLGQLGDGTTMAANEPVGVSVAEPFTSITANSFLACALTAAGAAYCWGEATNLLGATGPAGSLVPQKVSGDLALVALRAGGGHVCGLLSDGSAYCWGLNAFGRLGNGTQTPSKTPVAVSGGLRFATISASAAHTCGVTTGGDVYCWGTNVDGQLGDNTSINRLAPVAVSGGVKFAMVSAGASHTCGVSVTGKAYCWGANQSGELGNGTTISTATPVGVTNLVDVATLSAGPRHTCAVTTTHQAYCWGANSYGQLGTGNRLDASTPQAVTGGYSMLSVSANGGANPYAYYGYSDLLGHTCGMTTALVAYCWGSNLEGELGVRTLESFQTSPVKVSGQQ